MTVACNAKPGVDPGAANNQNCNRGNQLAVSESDPGTNCGTNTRTFSSPCGQSCQQVISVTGLPPDITCPAARSIPCQTALTDQATTSDPCGSAVNQATTGFDQNVCGTTQTVTYTATNQCSLTATCTQAVTVEAAAGQTTTTTTTAAGQTTTTTVAGQTTTTVAGQTTTTVAGQTTTTVAGQTAPGQTTAAGGSIPTTTPSLDPSAFACCGDSRQGSIISNGACSPVSSVQSFMCVARADPALPPTGTLLINAGPSQRIPQQGGTSFPPLIRLASPQGPQVIGGALRVIIEAAPVQGRYVLVDATEAGGYIGRFTSVDITFQPRTNNRAAPAVVCTDYTIAYDPLIVAADVSIPRGGCVDKLPFWAYIAMGCGLLLVAAIIATIIILVQRKRKRDKDSHGQVQLREVNGDGHTPYSWVDDSSGQPKRFSHAPPPPAGAQPYGFMVGKDERTSASSRPYSWVVEPGSDGSPVVQTYVRDEAYETTQHDTYANHGAYETQNTQPADNYTSTMNHDFDSGTMQVPEKGSIVGSFAPSSARAPNKNPNSHWMSYNNLDESGAL